jgi:Protein of unknown function (DUF3570)
MRWPSEKRHHRAVSRFALFGAIFVLWGILTPSLADAQAVEFDARTLFFFEPAKGSSMTVYTPSTDLTVRPWDFLAVSAGWEADIVSGASERIKAGPLSRNPDIVSGASVKDVRHMGRGSFTVKRDTTQLTLGGSDSSENDYKSRSFNGAVKTDLFQHNTEIELAYARNWDTVCDAVHTANTDVTLRQALFDSNRCFDSTATDRTTRPIRTDAFQITWSQAWTPELLTQLVYTGQVQNGFLSDPYRAVVLSPAGQFAQEHHPDNRARQALAWRAAYYLRGLKGAVRGGMRIYRDTWDVKSGTVELEGEKYIFPWLRLRVSGRYYRQSGAMFWSDDYTGGEPVHGPRGQYWSGDRELSPFSSVLVGGRLLASWTADERRILGIFQGFQAGFGVDVLLYNYTDFTLAGRAPLDTKAYLGSLSLTALF